MRLRVRKSPPVAVQDEKLLFTVVRAAFNQRRKTLVNVTYRRQLRNEKALGLASPPL